MRWWWCFGVFLVVGVAVLAGRLFVSSDSLLDRLDKTASVTSLVVGVASLLVAVAALAVAVRQGRERPSVEDAGKRLAERSRRKWAKEVAFRDVRNPWPVRVRWSSTTRPVTPARSRIEGGDDATALDGDVTNTVDKFRELPHRQLVVLGGAGAGKSVLALLLAVDLLEKHPHDPVPVLLAINSWDPCAESVDEFVIRRLLDEHSYLRARGADDTLASDLVHGGRVLPVLDGLDEMPASMRTRALLRFHELTNARRPFVLTSRAVEYQQAVRSSGQVLALAEVVEIEPVAPAEAATYLATTNPDRWEGVLASLGQPGPLAEAFSSPLAVSLARKAYTRPGAAHPNELLALTSKSVITDRLMSGFVSSVYHDHPKAELWLTTLAYMLYLGETRDLTWREFGLFGNNMWHRGARRLVPRLMALATAFAMAISVSTDSVVAGVWTGVIALNCGTLLLVVVRSLRTAMSDTLMERFTFSVLAPMGPTVSIFVAWDSLDGVDMWVPAVVSTMILAWTVADAVRPGTLVVPVGTWSMAAFGLLPWRLSRFLKASHARGVLRRSGTIWQFRHVAVQNHLARRARTRDLAESGSMPGILAAMLALQGGNALKARADSGDKLAAKQYSALLAANDRLDELAARTDLAARERMGDIQRNRVYAERRGADLSLDLLGVLGPEPSEPVEHAIREADEKLPQFWLVNYLIEKGELDAVRSEADMGNSYAAWRLAITLAAAGEKAEAVALMWDRVAAGDEYSLHALNAFLIHVKDRQSIIRLVKLGDGIAPAMLAQLRQPEDLDWLFQIGAIVVKGT